MHFCLKLPIAHVKWPPTEDRWRILPVLQNETIGTPCPSPISWGKAGKTQALLVGDGLIGKSIDFEATEQSFPLHGRLKGGNYLSKRAGIGRQNVTDHIAHPDVVRAFDDSHYFNAIFK